MSMNSDLGGPAPAVRATVDTLPDPVRRVVGYRLGWLDEHGRPGIVDSGKMIQAMLALLSAQAVGAVARMLYQRRWRWS